MTMTTERQPQAGDIYAYREDGAVLFIPPTRQLTTWRGGNLRRMAIGCAVLVVALVLGLTLWQ
ncbi:hypothetical protein [Delftia sp. ASV31]|uniref:hypothetical protein n=1 Tax=Delftia sp. ASV31 TaxID=2795113 RepID=UPI0018EA530C|nr:hypothetical protein [Delftia sp. ASV31]